VESTKFRPWARDYKLFLKKGLKKIKIRRWYPQTGCPEKGGGGFALWQFWQWI
jgi:hypothetical protein